MKITICGSMQFDTEMQQAKADLEKLGYEVEKPNVVEGHVYTDNLDANADLKRGFIDEHFEKINGSDAILVANIAKNGIANYIGGNTLLEIGHAYASGLEIFLLNPIPDVSYKDEIAGMQPIVLDGDLSKITEHYDTLPLVYMSTESPVKHLAVRRGLRRAGLRVRTAGQKVESDVSEQPLSVNETYDGAINRHLGLTAVAPEDAKYLVTIESGQHDLHADHNSFGCSVVVLEKVGGERKVGIDFDIEFPREMTDKVPSVYPDLGVLVQQEYGSKLKDPFPYFTGGKLTRANILENAVYNVAIQLNGE